MYHNNVLKRDRKLFIITNFGSESDYYQTGRI
jgi:hypothetical protein